MKIKLKIRYWKMQLSYRQRTIIFVYFLQKMVKGGSFLGTSRSRMLEIMTYSSSGELVLVKSLRSLQLFTQSMPLDSLRKILKSSHIENFVLISWFTTPTFMLLPLIVVYSQFAIVLKPEDISLLTFVTALVVKIRQ